MNNINMNMNQGKHDIEFNIILEVEGCLRE